MMIRRFFNQVAQGDVRSIIILLLLSFLLYLVLKASMAVYKKGEGFFKLLMFIFVGVVIYGVFNFPETVQIWFLAFADFLTALIEPLFKTPVPLAD